MTEPTGQGDDDVRAAKVAAVQAAVDRVTSWQDGATVETVRDELRKALDEAGVEVPDSFVEKVAAHVHSAGEHLDVEPLLD
jgi:Protein of unknown function (DUF3235)